MLVPVFESFIYPCFKKCGLLTPLQRIGTGGLLAGAAFVVSGIVELSLEVRFLYLLSEKNVLISLINCALYLFSLPIHGFPVLV